MMGDNRDNSADSRAWGPLDMKLISGKAMFIYFSWNPDSHAHPVLAHRRHHPLTTVFVLLGGDVTRAPAAVGPRDVAFCRLRIDMIGRRGWRQTGPPPRAREEHGGVDWRQDPRRAT